MLFSVLLLLVPASLVLAYAVHAPPLVVFVAAVLAIVPLAEWIRRATEQIARTAGPAIGGLLNVTFGNAAEFVLALFVLQSGHPDVVKAQITGSITGNALLGLGIAVIAGSWGRERQTFTRERASLLSSLLILAVIGLLVPALFDLTERGYGHAQPVGPDERLSIGASIVLISVYAANLVYTLVTHRDVFSFRQDADGDDATGRDRWPLWRAVAVLVAATAVIAFEAELVSGALEAAAGSLGVTTFFLGMVPLAIIGNASEYFAAVSFARQDRMGLVMSITVGSTIQVALFTAPLLVLVSYAMGRPMNLVFHNPLELVAVAASAFTVNAIAQDGETTWFEGVLLLGVYVILALAFLVVTP
jgi:Ca2+:H+ antiporter